MASKFNDVYEHHGDTGFMLEEFTPEAGAKSEIDGKNVIGKVTGPFFVPNGKSRNDRYYPESFWKSVLENKDLKGRMEDRLMYGKIGHDEREVTDEDLQNGNVSHIVTKLWMEKGKGMGEALILGTESGKNLSIYLKAKSKLATSSRGSGDYLEGEDHEGVPIVDHDSYYLETFDFVLKPGFLEAKPTLVEKIINNKIGEKGMSDKIIESLIASRDQLQTQVVEHLATIKEFQAASVKMESVIKESKEKADKLSWLSGVAEAMQKVSSTSSIESLLGFMEEHKLESLSEIVSLAKTCKDNEEVLNNLEAIQASVESATLYEEMGTADEIKESLEGYGNLGTLEELTAMQEELEDYKVIGDADKITSTLYKAEKILKAVNNKEKGVKIEALAKEHGLDVKVVEKMAKTTDIKLIPEALESLKQGAKLEKYKVGGEPEKKSSGKRDFKTESRSATYFQNLG